MFEAQFLNIYNFNKTLCNFTYYLTIPLYLNKQQPEKARFRGLAGKRITPVNTGVCGKKV